MIKHLGRLHTLHLNGCAQITDEGIKHFYRLDTLELLADLYIRFVWL